MSARCKVARQLWGNFARQLWGNFARQLWGNFARQLWGNFEAIGINENKNNANSEMRTDDLMVTSRER